MLKRVLESLGAVSIPLDEKAERPYLEHGGYLHQGATPRQLKTMSGWAQ